MPSESGEGSSSSYCTDRVSPRSVLADGTTAYLYGNGRLAQYQAGMQYFEADWLGSVRQIYDASGQVIGSSRYDPYGSLMSHSGTAMSVYGYTGEQWDAATGLEYLRARYYSPQQGRFLTRDAWEGDPNAPMSYNAWLYAYANSVNLTDPSGYAPQNPGDPDTMPGGCTTPWCWNNRWFRAHGYKWDNSKADWVIPTDKVPDPYFYDEDITNQVLAEGGVRVCGPGCPYRTGSAWSPDQKKVVARGLSIFGARLINEGGITRVRTLLGANVDKVDVYLDSPDAPIWCGYACAPPEPIVGFERSIFLTTGVMNYTYGYMDVVHELAHIVDWHSAPRGRRFSDLWTCNPLTDYAIKGMLQPAERFAEAVTVWVFNTPSASTYRNALLPSVTGAELSIQMGRMEALLKGWP